jgi:hypothetical protein
MQAKLYLAKECMYPSASSNAFVCMLPDTEQNKMKKDGGKVIENKTRGHSYFVHVPKMSNRSESGNKTAKLDHSTLDSKQMKRKILLHKESARTKQNSGGNHTPMMMAYL